MRNVLSCLVVLNWTCVLADNPAEGTCTQALELVQLQDGSASFGPHIKIMQGTASQLLSRLGTTFGEFKYGVASFVDKPIPTRGLGYYGNFASTPYFPDWCFEVHASMSTDPAEIAKGLGHLAGTLGGGGDFAENPYEALLLAAYNKDLGWTDAHITHSPSGRPIARLALVVTDDIPHVAGDAHNGANLGWGAARSYKNYDWSSGGFGSKTWGELANTIFADKDEYHELCDLFREEDLGGQLGDSEKTRQRDLIDKFGPYPWPDILPHPGDDSVNCSLVEYPSLDQVAAALRKSKITPIILVAEPELGISSGTHKECVKHGMPGGVECLAKIYEIALAEMNVNGVVTQLRSENVIDDIIEAIKEATSLLCLLPTETPVPPILPSTAQTTSTTEPTTTTTEPTTTTTEPTTTTTETTTTTTEPTTTTTEPTTTTTEPTTTTTEPTTTTTEPTTTSTTEPTTSTTESTTEPTTSMSETISTSEPTTTSPSTTTTTRTEEEGTEAVAGGGINIGLIAGAAGGGVVGVVALAGILYKTVGFSMFGGQPTPDAMMAEQVETPDSPIERETMETVTMDMFQ